MVTLFLPPDIESQDIGADEFLEFLKTHLDSQKVSQLKRFGVTMTDMVRPLIVADSESTFSDQLHLQTRQLRILYSKLQEEILGILSPHHIDKVVFIREFTKRSSAMFWRLIDKHSSWLSERDRQLLVISVDDKESYELWALELILTTSRLPSNFADRMKRIEENVLQAQLDLSGIMLIFADEEYSHAITFLVENLYENVANINLVLYEQDPKSTMPDSLLRHRSEQQDLDMMGYGKGRLEGETDEDVDAFIGEIRRLRDE